MCHQAGCSPKTVVISKPSAWATGQISVSGPRRTLSQSGEQEGARGGSSASAHTTGLCEAPIPHGLHRILSQSTAPKMRAPHGNAASPVTRDNPQKRNAYCFWTGFLLLRPAYVHSPGGIIVCAWREEGAAGWSQ